MADRSPRRVVIGDGMCRQWAVAADTEGGINVVFKTAPECADRTFGGMLLRWVFFFQAEDGIRDLTVTGVQTCALPISPTTTSVTALLQYTPSESAAYVSTTTARAPRSTTMRLRGWETIGPSDPARPLERKTTSSGDSSVVLAGTCTNAPSARKAGLSAAKALSRQRAWRARCARASPLPPSVRSAVAGLAARTPPARAAGLGRLRGGGAAPRP